jgi:hypothetical protein
MIPKRTLPSSSKSDYGIRNRDIHVIETNDNTPSLIHKEFTSSKPFYLRPAGSSTQTFDFNAHTNTNTPSKSSNTSSNNSSNGESIDEYCRKIRYQQAKLFAISNTIGVTSTVPANTSTTSGTTTTNSTATRCISKPLVISTSETPTNQSNSNNTVTSLTQQTAKLRNSFLHKGNHKNKPVQNNSLDNSTVTPSSRQLQHHTTSFNIKTKPNTDLKQFNLNDLTSLSHSIHESTSTQPATNTTNIKNETLTRARSNATSINSTSNLNNQTQFYTDSPNVQNIPIQENPLSFDRNAKKWTSMYALRDSIRNLTSCVSAKAKFSKKR